MCYDPATATATKLMFPPWICARFLIGSTHRLICKWYPMCFLRPDILCFFDSNSNGICTPHSDMIFIFVGLIWMSVSGCTYSFWRLGCGFAFAFSLAEFAMCSIMWSIKNGFKRTSNPNWAHWLNCWPGEKYPLYDTWQRNKGWNEATNIHVVAWYS